MSTIRSFRCSCFVITTMWVALSFGSAVRQMSFEEATQRADIVVVGRVLEKPRLAVLDSKSGEVLRHNSVQVEQYLKGAGPERISVLTPGGRYLADTPQGKEEQFVNYGGAPDLPDAGTSVLLFLQPFGADGDFVVSSVSHGIRELQPASNGGERTVRLAFSQPEVMTPSARSAHDEWAKHGGNSQELFSDTVPISQLQDLVQRASKKAPPTPPASSKPPSKP